jgi:quinate dehydrogenase (quinone)
MVGFVDLKAGLGNVADDPKYQLSSAPTMAGTTVVVGGRVADNVQTDMPGGVMRGFDVITGEMRWAFDPGHDDPNDKKAAGPDLRAQHAEFSWAPMSYDPAMNTVFMPMGSSSVDLWGGKRTKLDHTLRRLGPGADASTGKQKWVYQTVHNDLWDFDLPMQPSLIDFTKKDGSKVPAVVIGTKAGQIYVFDRMTGKPLTRSRKSRSRPRAFPRSNTRRLSRNRSACRKSARRP